MMTIEEIADTVRAQVAEHDQLAPRFLVASGKHLDLVFTESFDGDDEKEATATVVRRIVKEKNADCVVFVSESWTVRDDRAKAFEIGRRAGLWRAVSECPWREEVVMFLVETKTSQMMAMAPIKRLPNGKRELGAVQRMPIGRMAGRMTGFLQQDEVAQ